MLYDLSEYLDQLDVPTKYRDAIYTCITYDGKQASAMPLKDVSLRRKDMRVADVLAYAARLLDEPNVHAAIDPRDPSNLSRVAYDGEERSSVYALSDEWSRSAMERTLAHFLGLVGAWPAAPEGA